MIRNTLRIVLSLLVPAGLCAQTDPGPRSGAAGAGGAISGLTTNEGLFFTDGKSRFNEVDTADSGLGPRFNLNSCGGCHAHPAAGGSSPVSNPQVTGNVAPASQVAKLTGLGLIMLRGRDRSTPIPFGPFLAGAGWLMLIFGRVAVAGYFGLFAGPP